MGTCESILNEKPKKKKTIKKNLGGQRFRAPVNSNNHTYFGNGISQRTLDISQTRDKDLLYNKKPKVYKYINEYNNQKSLVNGTLVELGQGNSLMNNKIKNSFLNGTYNSIYTNNIDETGNLSSFEAIEMIQDGKVDFDMVKKSTDKTTINNYNEFIGKKNNNHQKKDLINCYYKKKNTNKNEGIKDGESSATQTSSNNPKSNRIDDLTI